ncbi:hypothetical protein BGX29_010656 [Mortierella sp. GBA35]|nr:hypothetical protein BGX29_010656 [Mortierella sp. GBA35]
MSVVYSPGDDIIASGVMDETVIFWKTGGGLADVSSGVTVRMVIYVHISPCGSRVAMGGDDGSVHLWESLTGQPEVVMEGHSDRVVEVAFSSCGGTIASASLDKTVRLRAWTCLEAHTETVLGVVYSSSGLQIVSCGSDNTVRLWCPQTGEQQHVLEHPDATNQAAYSSDKQYLISLHAWTDPQKPFCWDAGSDQPVGRLDGIDFETTLGSFSPDGRFFTATAEFGGLRLWNVALDQPLDIHEADLGSSFRMKWIHGLDGIYLATTIYGLLHVWKLVEKGETYCLQLARRLGLQELILRNASMDGVVGLSPTNRALMEQRLT